MDQSGKCVSQELWKVFNEMKQNHERKKDKIEKLEAGQKFKVDMMEAAMPAVIAWNMFQNCKTKDKLPFNFKIKPGETGPIKDTRSEDDLKVAINNKIDELLREQDAISELYTRAHKNAKDREIDLKNRMFELEQNSMKDKQMLDTLRKKINF